MCACIPIRYTPTASVYAQQACGGVAFVVTDREALRPVALGMEVASALARLYPKDYTLKVDDRLVGSRSTVTRILAGEDPAAVAASWAADEARWRLLRAKVLALYARMTRRLPQARSRTIASHTSGR